MNQYTDPVHLDAPREVVFAYLTDLIGSVGRCGLHEDRNRQGDSGGRGHHVWAQAAGEALGRKVWRVVIAKGPRR